MIRHIVRAVIGLVVNVPLVLAAQGFEGAITLRVNSGRAGAPPQEIEYLTRNGNVRVNINAPTGAMSILGLQAESKTYMLMESQRMYMEMPKDDIAAAIPRNDDAKVTKTGRKETIAGESCEHVIVETNGTNGPQKTDACMAAGLGPFVMPMSRLNGLSTWQRQLMKENGFPLRVTLGDGSVALEVTKIEKKRVNADLFRIPADFSKMDMPRRP